MATSAPYNVANGTATPGSTVFTVTVGSGTGSPTGTAAGDLVYVLLTDGLNETPVSVTDSQGNTYAQQVAGPAVTQRPCLWASLTTSALVSGTDTITVTWPSSTGNKFMIACGASGIASATADKSASANGTSVSPSSGATATLSQASEVAVGGIKNTSTGGTPSALSFGSGLTLNQGGFLTEFHQVVTTTAAKTASGTIVSAQWGALIATFKISLPVITTTGLPNATSGSAYSQTLTVTGGLPSYTYAITSGTLTGSGITMSSAGVFSGTATGGSASYPITVTVTDGNGNTDPQALTLNVTGTGFANVQNGSPASGTGSVAVTLPVASTAGNLLVAAVEAAGTGPFTGPAGWTQAAFTGGGTPVLLGERNKTFDYVTGAGVTGLTTAIAYIGGIGSQGGTITEGIPAHWPAGIYQSDVVTQIFDFQPNLADTLNGALDSNHIALMTSAPAGSWLMPYHEPGVLNPMTAATTHQLDIYLIALKNRNAPSLLYGRGVAAGDSTALDPTTIPDPGYSYTSTNASPAVFTVASGAFNNTSGGAQPNGCSVTLGTAGCPTGFTPNKVYYVVGVSGNTFQLANTIGGTGVGATSTGSGTVAPAPDFIGMDGYQHVKNTGLTPAGRFDAVYNTATAINPNCKLAIIETATAIQTPTPVAAVTAWLNALLAYAQARPNLFSINTFWTYPGPPADTPGPGSQLWQNSFAPAEQALSNGLAALGGGGSSNDVELWYRANAPATSSATFTGPGGVLCRGAMAEFSSPAGTSQALDAAPGTGGGPAPATSLPVSTAVANGAGDLGVVAFGNWFTSNPAGTWTSPTGYSRVAAFGAGGTSLFDFEYKTGLGAGTQTVTGVYSTSANQVSWGAVAATFKQVFSAPVITTSSLSGATAGTSYTSTAMAATGGVTPYTWSAGAGKPAGVLLSSAGAWSGSPSTPGTYTFNVTVTDQNGATGSKSFTLAVATAVDITTAALPGAITGTPYSSPNMTSAGGTAPLAYAVVAGTGTLPTGITLSSAGVWGGTPSVPGTYGFAIGVTDANGSFDSDPFTITVGSATGPPPPGPAAFPGAPLGIKVELQINGTWTDITHYVYVRDGITITGGASAEGSTPTPSNCTLTLNNRDGRFSPGTPGALAAWGGAYLLRNILLRVSVTATSAVGVPYSGYRFWGFVSTWPPQSDVSGNDVYVQVSADGPLRQVTQGGGKGGALTRYYHSLDGTAYAPAAYWPCEEDTSTFFIDSGVYAGQVMKITGTPLWKGNNSFNGTSPMPVVNKSTWDGITGQFNSSGDDTYTIPGTYTWVASTPVVQVNLTGGAGGGGGGPAGNGAPGGASTFSGDVTAVTANGGSGGTGTTGGAGGTGSGNSVHFHGGAGANGSGNGGGGGSSGGSAANGNPGSGTTGGAAVTGGGKGGNGGIFGIGGSAPQAGSAPGGGGGGSAFPAGPGGGGGEFASEPSVVVTPGRAYQVTVGAGGTGNSAAAGGGAGLAELVYTPASGNVAPPVNVVRFLMEYPPWGIPATAVLLRFFTAAVVVNSNLTHFDVVQVAGGLQLKGYTGAGLGSLNFTSSTLNIPAGQPVMVSVELQNNNSGGVQCQLKAIVAGAATLLGTVTKTVASSVIDNVTEVIVGPNADVTKTAVGHITVQYALVPLTAVSDAVNGHYGEMGIDRFIRLCGEQALGNAVQFAETQDHWGFEGGVQSWASGGNCTITTSTFSVPANLPVSPPWPVQGAQSLLATSTATGSFSVISPFGTAGQPVTPGDVVTAGCEIYAPAALGAAYMGIKFFTATGAALAETDSIPVAVAAGSITTLKAKTPPGGAPATAAFFNLHVGNSDAACPASTQMYVDNVRVSPRMGTQTREAYLDYLHQIQFLEQGMLKEAKTLFGLGYKTRIALISQAPAVTLDYNLRQVAPPLQPVQDDKLTVTQLTVKRTEGSRVTVSQSAGQITTSLPPPFGGGRPGAWFAKQAKVVAEDDAQLIALATHLLGLGTDTSTRYPVITVNLAGTGVAPEFDDVAQAEIGDRIQIINLPSWYPETTADQLIIGYTETLNYNVWTISWNCQPFTPWGLEITNTRRW